MSGGGGTAGGAAGGDAAGEAGAVAGTAVSAGAPSGCSRDNRAARGNERRGGSVGCGGVGLGSLVPDDSGGSSATRPRYRVGSACLGQGHDHLLAQLGQAEQVDSRAFGECVEW